MVGLGRFELPTSPLSGVRSNQLSYRPGTRILEPYCRSGPDCLLCCRMDFTHPALELSRKVSRTQLNMRNGYAVMTIVKTGKRKREGLAQAHACPPKRTGMVLGNVTVKLNGS